MLDVGFIQLIHSLFSSPVLLVKKKDGIWPCYIDYQAMNVVTVKEIFDANHR